MSYETPQFYPADLDRGIFDRMHVVSTEIIHEKAAVSRLQRMTAGVGLAFWEGEKGGPTLSLYQDYEMFWSTDLVTKALCEHYLAEHYPTIAAIGSIEFFYTQAYRVVLEEDEAIILQGIFQGMEPDPLEMHYYSALFTTSDALATEIVMKFA